MHAKICDFERGDAACVDMCMYARLDGGAPQWIFQFHVVFSFAHRRLPPVGIILRPGSLETPFGKLNFRSMCGMFVYGCDLLALRKVQLGLLSCWGRGGSESGRRRRRNLSISNSPSVVNSSIYRHGIRCIANRLGSFS